MRYNADVPGHREMLAVSIIEKLDECGFSKEVNRPSTTEAVYSRVVSGTNTIKVMVYTSIVPHARGCTIRGIGDDSIKVVAIYTGRSGKERGIVKETRIHRVGEIEDIVNRMHLRMRSVYRKAATGQRCNKCGAPKFYSKRGNLVCADLCWLSEEECCVRSNHYKPRDRGHRWHRRSSAG